MVRQLEVSVAGYRGQLRPGRYRPEVRPHAPGRGQRLASRGLRVTRLTARAPVLAIGAVSLDMFGQVVRSHEPLVTSRTREPLLSSVGPQMSLEFV